MARHVISSLIVLILSILTVLLPVGIFVIFFARANIAFRDLLTHFSITNC